MPNMTISVDSQLYKRMKEYEYINWSAVARIGFRIFVESLDKENMTKKQYEDKILHIMLEIIK